MYVVVWPCSHGAHGLLLAMDSGTPGSAVRLYVMTRVECIAACKANTLTPVLFLCPNKNNFLEAREMHKS